MISISSFYSGSHQSILLVKGRAPRNLVSTGLISSKVRAKQGNFMSMKCVFTWVEFKIYFCNFRDVIKFVEKVFVSWSDKIDNRFMVQSRKCFAMIQYLWAAIAWFRIENIDFHWVWNRFDNFYAIEIIWNSHRWSVVKSNFFFCEMLLFYSPTIFRNSPMGNLDILRLEKWHFMYFENRWNIKIFPWHFLKRFWQVCNYQ